MNTTFRLFAESDISSVMENGMDMGQRLTNGGQMILVLMAFVFAVIFTIFLSQTIISRVIVAFQSKAKREKDTKMPEIVKVSEPVIEDESDETDNDVTVAVITAALAAYLAENSEDGTVLPFRVVSFSRKKNGKPWNSKF